MQSVCTQNLRKPNTEQEGLHTEEAALRSTQGDFFQTADNLKQTRPQRNRKALLTACTAETAGIPLESRNALEGLFLFDCGQPQAKGSLQCTPFLAFCDLLKSPCLPMRTDLKKCESH